MLCAITQQSTAGKCHIDTLFKKMCIWKIKELSVDIVLLKIWKKLIWKEELSLQHFCTVDCWGLTYFKMDLPPKKIFICFTCTFWDTSNGLVWLRLNWRDFGWLWVTRCVFGWLDVLLSDLGSFAVIWGDLGSFAVIWGHLGWFAVI